MMKANKIIYYLAKDSKGKWVENHAIAVFAKDQSDLWNQIQELAKTGKKMLGVAVCKEDFNHNQILG